MGLIILTPVKLMLHTFKLKNYLNSNNILCLLLISKLLSPGGKVTLEYFHMHVLFSALLLCSPHMNAPDRQSLKT